MATFGNTDVTFARRSDASVRMLERLMVRFRAKRLFQDPVQNEQHILWLKHLDQTVEVLRQDGDMLLKWIEDEIKKAQFLASKYAGAEDVDFYHKRVEVMKRLHDHLTLLITPGAL